MRNNLIVWRIGARGHRADVPWLVRTPTSAGVDGALVNPPLLQQGSMARWSTHHCSSRGRWRVGQPTTAPAGIGGALVNPPLLRQGLVACWSTHHCSGRTRLHSGAGWQLVPGQFAKLPYGSAPFGPISRRRRTPSVKNWTRAPKRSASGSPSTSAICLLETTPGLYQSLSLAIFGDVIMVSTPRG